MKNTSIALACSPGGHMKQMMQLEDVYSKHDHFFYTFKRQMSLDLSEKEDIEFVSDTRRNPLIILLSILQSIIVVLKRRPRIVIANGGGFVIPFCWWAKITGSKIIFIESFARVNAPSISGRLIHPISDLFIVQWKGMKKFYSKSVLGGWIF